MLDLPYCPSFVNWLNSYPHDRSQRVKLDNARSSNALVTSGIPQGSALGPLLFALYFSSYKSYSNQVCSVKYADDVTLVIPVLKKTTE